MVAAVFDLRIEDPKPTIWPKVIKDTWDLNMHQEKNIARIANAVQVTI